MKKWQTNHVSPLFMLTGLTLLFVVFQLIVFIIHYQVSSLIDSVAGSSMAAHLKEAVIWMPLVGFISMQVLAYVVFVGWIRFISQACAEVLTLKPVAAYGLAIVTWVFGCLAIMTFNAYLYPHSFFAVLLGSFWLTWLNEALLILSVSVLLVMTGAAYVNVMCYRRHQQQGYFFLMLLVVMSGLGLWNALTPSASASVESFKKPNIIIIGLDSLRPDFVGYYQHQPAQTPALNQFLKSGSVFTQAYTPLARTFPAWVSILTANYPKHHLARTNLAEQTSMVYTNTLAQRLQQAGYFTVYASDEKRFSNITSAFGFDRVIGPRMGVNDFLLGGLSDFPLTNILVNSPMGRWLFPYNYGNRAAAITYQPDHFLRVVTQDLAHRPHQPVFLAVHLCLSHWPFSWARDGEPSSMLLPARYQQSVQALDQQFAALMQQLKQQGLLENSLVVVLSDHGTALGLLGDRLIKKTTYQGDAAALKKMAVAKLSNAPAFSTDFQHDYSINTSYGQGTDLLSMAQYRVVLAFKAYGRPWPAQRLTTMSSLLDVAPTILDFIEAPRLSQVDGVSLRAAMLQRGPSKPRFIFLETGDSIADIETSHIQVEKVIQKDIGIFNVDPATGFLFMKPDAQASLIKNKQRGIVTGEWLLVRYPASAHILLAPASGGRMTLQSRVEPPYYVLVNLKTQQWTMNLSSALAKTAPVSKLMKQLAMFYGNELGLRPDLLTSSQSGTN